MEAVTSFRGEEEAGTRFGKKLAEVGG